MSLDAKKKRLLAICAIALVAVVGVGWALTSTGESTPVRADDRPVADKLMDDDDLGSSDEVAVRSSPKSRSGSSRLEGASDKVTDQDDKLVTGVSKKTKRGKKAKRRRAKKQQAEEEEATTSSGKAPRQPVGR